MTNSKYQDYLYFIFRILVGALFLQHGLQKLFGFFGMQPVALFSLFGLAGVIEFLGGILIIFGLFTRVAALISGLLMIVAYFYVHFPGGFYPILNQGELALLYFAAFLVLMVNGSGIFSLGRAIFKR